MSKILGLDLGTNSIGWALIDARHNNIIGSGVRIFQEGVADLGKGDKEMSRSASRREARGARRQAFRRRMRKNLMLKLLAENKMCPGDPSNYSHQSMQQRFPDDLLNEWFALNPYELRANAIHKKLTLHELGRIFYHMIQRRGFQSNSRSAGGELNDKSPLIVGDPASGKTGINETESAIATHQTLGAYLHSIQPEEGASYRANDKRIRNRYTTRKMYVDEFNAIWDKQAPLHSSLTDELRQKIGGIKKHGDQEDGVLFYQRPLRSQKGLIGKCSLEPKKHRSPLSHYLYEEFNILQWVNTVECNNVPLSFDDKEILVRELQSKASIKFSQLRKKLKKHGSDFQFNYKDDDVIKKANTIPALSNKKFFGPDWFEFDEKLKEDIWHALYFFEDRDKLREYAIERWNFSDEKADAISKYNLKDGYGNLSRKAVKNILPFLGMGKKYNVAVALGGVKNALGTKWNKLRPEEQVFLLEEVNKIIHQKKKGGFIDDLKAYLKENYKLSNRDLEKLYHHSAEVNSTHTLEKLPMGTEGDRLINNIKNPVVVSALFELRKVVNGIISEYGKPDEIKIELARDLKMSKQRRWETRREQQRLERENDRVKQELERLNQRITHDNLLKFKLWEECNHTCPFTGRQISIQQLFSGEIQIEHIQPWSRSLNDSFANKTLCFADENRAKGNRTPYEFYSKQGEVKWEEVKTRALACFHNKDHYPKAYHKFKHFVKKQFDDDFVSRQLNDTRYISVAAKTYVKNICEKVTVFPGQATAKLRHHWGLNGILNSDEQKSRDDHRHHAVDALTVACSTTKHFQDLARWNAYQQSPKEAFPLPWEGFVKEANDSIQAILVSHKPNKKVLNRRTTFTETNGVKHTNLGLEARGQLHKESVYGRRQDHSGNFAFHLRKDIASLETKKQIDKVVDPAIRKLLYLRVETKGGFDAKGKVPKNCFVENDANGNPITTVFLKNEHGEKVPVRKVRMKENISGAEKLKPSINQYVNPRNNHHILIYKDHAGNLKEEVVTFWVAAERKKQGIPVVQLPEDGEEIMYNLKMGDLFFLNISDQQKGLFRVQKLSSTDYNFRLVSEATIDSKEKTKYQRFTSIKAFLNCVPLPTKLSPIGIIL